MAGTGLTMRIIGQDVCTQIVAMAVITAIITPILRQSSFMEKDSRTYRRDNSKGRRSVQHRMRESVDGEITQSR